MRRLFAILVVVSVAAVLMAFSTEVQAGSWRHGGRGHIWHGARFGGGGHIWHGPRFGGHGWYGGHRWHRGVGRWYSGWRGWYPIVTPGAVIVDDWADCDIVRRCFVDRFGCRRCRWVRICP